MNKPNKTELEYFIRYSLDIDKYKRYMELYEEIVRLNNIINKAIEYIEHCQTFSTRKPYVNGDDLLDILKGVDKE